MAYAKGTKGKSTKAAKLEVVDDDEDELEEEDVETEDDDDEDDDEEVEEAPPAKKSKKAAPAPAAKKAASSDNKGVGWLCELIESKTGKTYKPQILRVLLRKMQNAGELGEREAKTRYSFGGEKDPVVVAILKRVKAGEIEQTRTENLEKLKARAAEKKGAGKAGKKKAKVVVEDDDFEDDEDDD